MKIRASDRARCPLAFTLLLAALPGLASAQQVQVNLDPAKTKINWTLKATLHEVHGTFALKSGSIVFDPKTGDASGEIVVDATSGESGNHSRDSNMHKDVLESQRYPEIVFLSRHVTGNLVKGPSNVQVQGILRLHGADHDLTLTVALNAIAGQVTATTSFIVPYQAWGLKDPGTTFLHVEDKVAVTVSTIGQVSEAAGPAPSR